MEPKELHPNTKQLLAYFEVDLAPNVYVALRPFRELAAHVAYTIEGPEATACLRKLLEAQDCATRALR